MKNFATIMLLALAGTGVMAKENINGPGKTAKFYKSQAAACAPASSQLDLDINNVRTTLLNGGDMWWNLNDARYEVPKVPTGTGQSVNALFAGAIWLGGIDAGGQLKIAAQTYRQTGNDFFPGPLDASSNVDDAVCNDYDKMWAVYSSEIDTFRIKTFPVSTSQVPKNILEWPAKGNPYAQGAIGQLNISQDLAPFWDVDGDQLYDPTQGDYPVINPAGSSVYGDQMIFWVYNDKGNIHSETGGQAIGVQIGALAFAFKTSDEINNMTFYRYNIVNKANIPVNNFYMGQWVDADLGCFTNDYVGCDTAEDLGYVYNGTATDPDCATRGYGASPPILGVDYFEGPQGLGMSTFLYYNNDFTVTGNPEAAIHFYNYMRGFWKDGTPFTSDACSGKGGSVATGFMFPDDPGGPVFPGSWSECSCNNAPADRRWMQASGPFTLTPGSVDNITVGVVWVRQGSQAGCAANIDLLRAADRKAQALFDNNFKLVDGPDAPSLLVRELSNEVIISLVNTAGSNNINEKYDETDPAIKAVQQSDPTVKDTTFTFQGYKLYQLKNNTVAADDLDDPTQARLVAQVDVKDSVARLVNFIEDPILQLDVPTLMVDGTNQGIKHTFNIKQDLFAEGNSTLVNHKTYYFAAIAYASNYYESQLTGEVQTKPYLQGRRRFQVYSAIPHIPSPSQSGTILHSAYGDSIAVTRLEGAGNGGNSVELDSASIESILANNFYGPIKYIGGRAPLDVKVTDPYVIKDRRFVVTFLPGDTPTRNIDLNRDRIPFVSRDDSFKVDIFDVNGNLERTLFSGQTIRNLNEFVLASDDVSYGVSIALSQVTNTGVRKLLGESLGFIDASITFKDSERPWFNGVPDQSTFSYLNWIRSGQYVEPTASPAPPDYLNGFFDDHHFQGTIDTVSGRDAPLEFYDPQQNLGNILGGTWSPYALATNAINGDLDGNGGADGPKWPSIYSYGPAFTVRYRYSPSNNYAPGGAGDVIVGPNYFRPTYTLDRLQSVDVVLTSDKSKWTRSVVVELGEDSAINEGNALKGFIRKHLSIDKEGNIETADTGRSWFPGYAINVETGERLNIMFGEDSWLATENGRDMIWNPTSEIISPLNQVLFGGRHNIYVMDTRYDEGEYIQQTMLHPPKDSAYVNLQGNPTNRLYGNTIDSLVYQHIMWVTMPVVDPRYPLASLADGIIPGGNDVSIKIRVRRPFTRYYVSGDSTVSPNQGFPQYEFNTFGLEPETKVQEVAESSLDLIKAVPNPYYAYSSYEQSQLDNRVKITNLPANCTITIYSIDGTLIRQYNRAVSDNTHNGDIPEKNTDNSLDWDLKNATNIPISSGVYLIHINAEGIGEKVIKWFGVLRPTDLDTF